MISPCPPYYSSALSYLLRSHHVLLFRLVASDCLSIVRPSLVALSSLLLSLSLSPCRSHPVFIFCLAILLAFCLLFSAMRQLLSDIEKLGCGCHTRAPKPISVSCVCRGAEARRLFVSLPMHNAIQRVFLIRVTFSFMEYNSVHSRVRPLYLLQVQEFSTAYRAETCFVFSPLGCKPVPFDERSSTCFEPGHVQFKFCAASKSRHI